MYNKYCTVTYQMLDTFDKYILKTSDYTLPSQPLVKDVLVTHSGEKLPSEKIHSIVEHFNTDLEDSLFWCVYVHLNGVDEFIEIQKYKNKEICEKMQIVNYLGKNSFPKVMKISKSVQQEIIGSLMINKKTDIQTVNGLCVYYNIHLLIVHEKSKTFIEYNNEQENTCIIYRNSSSLSGASGMYKLDLDVSESKISEIKNNFMKFESYGKSLNNISSYKLDELIEISSKLGLSTTKMTKSKLYEQIRTKLI